MPQPVSEHDFSPASSLSTVTTTGNFDVLLEEEVEESSLRQLPAPKLRLRRHQQHVGNNRFQVLVTMHKQEYEKTVTAGQNTRPIIDRITNIVCNQVQPVGRFLLYDKQRAVWTPLDSGRVIDFVGEQLDATLSGGGARTGMRSSLNRRVTMSHFSSHPASLAEPPLPEQQPGLRSVTTSLLPDDNSSDEFFLQALEPVPLPAHFRGNNHRNHRLGDLNEDDDDDDTKKRRRRSSLLRRSMSESVLMFDDKKKAMRQQSLLFGEDVATAALAAAAALEDYDDDASLDEGRLQQPHHQTSAAVSKIKTASSHEHSNFRRFVRSDSLDSKKPAVSTTTTAEQLDVIFTSPSLNNGSVLAPSHTGNNRLIVLMNVQMARYVAACGGDHRNGGSGQQQAQRLSILQDLQETVGKHWGGRFLQEAPELTYQLLSPADAMELLVRAMDERVIISASSASNHTSTTAGGGGYAAAAASGWGMDDSMSSIHSSTSMSSNGSQRRPSHVKRESLHAIHKPAGDHLRNAAIESLQKRKKRQGLFSRISALTRSTSEPIRVEGQEHRHRHQAMGDSLSSLEENIGELPPAFSPPQRASHLVRSVSSPQAYQYNQRQESSLASNNYSPIKDYRYSNNKPRASLAGMSDLSEGQINDLLSTLGVGDTPVDPSMELLVGSGTSADFSHPYSHRNSSSPFDRNIRPSIALSQLSDGQVKDLLASLDVTADHCDTAAASGTSSPAWGKQPHTHPK